jgi:SAM-dependent methyltransferase
MVPKRFTRNLHYYSTLEMENRNQFQLRLSRSVPIIKKLYHKTNAKHISNSFRHHIGTNDPSLTYGEVDAASFMQILGLTKSIGAGGKFVDLGCGAGMPCICAAMSPYGFSDITGIEIVEGLVDLANTLHSRLLWELNSDSALIDGEDKVSVKPKPGLKRGDGEIDLLPLVCQVLHNQNSGIAMDLLATEVCKLCGHKCYKASLKKHKSFLKLLQSYPDQFCISEDGKHVSLSMEKRLPEEAVVNCKIPSDEKTHDGCLADLLIAESDKLLFSSLTPVKYIHGSIFDYDWTDCDVAYTASLLFSEEMMLQLVPLVFKMKTGSFFISLKPLPLSDEHTLRIKLVNDSFFKMSWQMARVLTYQIQGVDG